MTSVTHYSRRNHLPGGDQGQGGNHKRHTPTVTCPDPSGRASLDALAQAVLVLLTHRTDAGEEALMFNRHRPKLC